MENLISGTFADILRRGRGSFNGRFAYYRSLFPLLEPTALLEITKTDLGPIVEAAAAVDADRAAEVAEALFDLAINMLGRNFLGRTPRYPALPGGWFEVLKALPHLLVAAPKVLPGAVFNALLQLESRPGLRPGLWRERAIAVGKRLTEVEAFLDMGRVLAWVAGMAGLREQALELLEQIDAENLCLLFDLPAGSAIRPDVFRRNLTRYPWLSPAQALGEEPAVKLVRVASVGAFVGHGGAFGLPPVVLATEDGLLTRVGDEWWRIQADGFGQTLVPAIFAGGLPPFPGEPGARIEKGVLRWGPHECPAEEWADHTGIGATATTVGVSMPYSHRVFLLGLAAAEGERA